VTKFINLIYMYVHLALLKDFHETYINQSNLSISQLDTYKIDLNLSLNYFVKQLQFFEVDTDSFHEPNNKIVL